MKLQGIITGSSVSPLAPVRNRLLWQTNNTVTQLHKMEVAAEKEVYVRK